MNRFGSVSGSESAHENSFSVSLGRSPVEADKKINLARGNFISLGTPAGEGAPAQRPPVDGRSHGLRVADGLPLARSAWPLRPVEFGLHALAPVVSVWAVGQNPGALARQATGTLRFLDASHIKVHQDASNPAGGQQNQAIGRTKGGLNTKLTAWVDAVGRAVAVSLAPGQRADVRAVQETVWPRGLRGKTVVADKGYDSDGLRRLLRRRGSRSCIPPRARRRHPAGWHRGSYRRRHKVENFFQRAKRYRRIGTRYEKRDLYFLSFVQLGAILDWLK